MDPSHISNAIAGFRALTHYHDPKKYQCCFPEIKYRERLFLAKDTDRETDPQIENSMSGNVTGPVNNHGNCKAHLLLMGKPVGQVSIISKTHLVKGADVTFCGIYDSYWYLQNVRKVVKLCWTHPNIPKNKLIIWIRVSTPIQTTKPAVLHGVFRKHHGQHVAIDRYLTAGNSTGNRWSIWPLAYKFWQTSCPTNRAFHGHGGSPMPGWFLLGNIPSRSGWWLGVPTFQEMPKWESYIQYKEQLNEERLWSHRIER